MASSTIESALDKENNAASGLTARTPLRLNNAGLRLPADESHPLKPTQRSLSQSSALQNVKNTPLKTPLRTPTQGYGACEGHFAFKTPSAVRPKERQSPIVSPPDPLSYSFPPVPADNEDYPGEFIPPSQRVSNYLDSFVKCNVFALWGFPCVTSTGSTSDAEDDDDDEARRLMNISRLLDDSVRRRQPTSICDQPVAPASGPSEDDLPVIDVQDRKQR